MQLGPALARLADEAEGKPRVIGHRYQGRFAVSRSAADRRPNEGQTYHATAAGMVLRHIQLDQRDAPDLTHLKIAAVSASAGSRSFPSTPLAATVSMRSLSGPYVSFSAVGAILRTVTTVLEVACPHRRP